MKITMTIQTIEELISLTERNVILLTDYSRKIEQLRGELPTEELLKHRISLEEAEARIVKLVDIAYRFGQRDAYTKVIDVANSKPT